MSSISITKLYDLLSVKVGKETAENLTIFIEEKINREMESRATILATKTDISDVRKEIAESKAELLKWMFIFWVGQVTATIGTLLLFVKK